MSYGLYSQWLSKDSINVPRSGSRATAAKSKDRTDRSYGNENNRPHRMALEDVEFRKWLECWILFWNPQLFVKSPRKLLRTPAGAMPQSIGIRSPIHRDNAVCHTIPPRLEQLSPATRNLERRIKISSAKRPCDGGGARTARAQHRPATVSTMLSAATAFTEVGLYHFFSGAALRSFEVTTFFFYLQGHASPDVRPPPSSKAESARQNLENFSP